MSEDQKYEIALGLRELGEDYNSVALLTIARQYVTLHPSSSNSHLDLDLESLKLILEKHAQLNQVIEKLQFRSIHKLESLIDGKTIQSLYDCKPGKHMKFLIKECLKFQILNLDSTREQVEAYMKANQEVFMAKYS